MAKHLSTPEFLTTAEAADELGVSVRRVQQLLLPGGPLKGRRFGRDWMVLADSLNAARARNRRVGRPPKD